MSDLKVCPGCGWYAHNSWDEPCEPARGVAARELAALVKVKSTQLGYGRDNMAFSFHDECSIRVEVLADGRFRIRDWFCLGWWTKEEVAELINAIATTRIGRAQAGDEED